MQLQVIVVMLMFFASFSIGAEPGAEPAAVKLIVDTDIASDCDDAGALAMVNALADRGEAELLAVMVATGGPYGAPAASAINAWYGRDVPIGTLKDPRFWSGGDPSQPSGAYNFDRYNRVLAEKYSPPLRHGDDAPDARLLYRKILAAQPDDSVVINTLGALINLHHLLQTPPDEHSPLDGKSLVARKVKQLVVCGGKNPKGTSSNFSKASAGPYTKSVIDNWPTPILFVGNEIGGPILTGFDRAVTANKDHPARLAYTIFHHDDEAKKRPSWDQAGVLVAVRGFGNVYGQIDVGHMTCDDKGMSEWSGQPAEGKRHAYLTKRADADAKLTEILESLMNQPRRAVQLGPDRPR